MKPKVAFICVHNSCRSQMAEALGKLFASDVFDSYSAGTETKPQINEDAIKVIKDLYGVDMSKTQHSNSCWYSRSRYRHKDGVAMLASIFTFKIRRGLEFSPTGKSEDEFKRTAMIIEEKMKDLKEQLKITT